MASGDVGYPSYMEHTHHNWLDGFAVGDDSMTYSIVDLMDTAQGVGGNPYEGETAFDPDAALTLVATSPLGRTAAAQVAAQAVVDGLSSVPSVWATDVATVAGEFGHFDDIDFLDGMAAGIAGLLAAVDDAVQGAYVDNMVSAYETIKKTRFMRELSMWTAGMADINAVNTSSFVIGMALKQKEFADSVDEFKRTLQQDLYKDLVQQSIAGYIKAETNQAAAKDAMLTTGPQMIAKGVEFTRAMEAEFAKLQVNLVQLKAEIERMVIISQKEYQDEQLSIDTQEALWPFEIYMYGGNLMASIAGAAAYRKGPSRLETTLGYTMAALSLARTVLSPSDPTGAGATGMPLGATIYST